ncbi:hypothetical protein C8D93_105190 [Sinimarinibacterium flocculans]|uniref:Uncharacterized protein n=1 Tax=Sinimarinibacterium flocculans TaxID=985250 RepID=A0A318E805_9GAMM|nr:hypothetical protein C8D93_105190 [Sinimarinibacterium flocculans]
MDRNWCPSVQVALTPGRAPRGRVDRNFDPGTNAGAVLASRPSRARGSKHRLRGEAARGGPSRPSRARGSKLNRHREVDWKIQSRPSRARGSKLQRLGQQPRAPFVAPLAGAWIETSTVQRTAHWRASRAPRGRVDRNREGCRCRGRGAAGRAPRGRVDRNASDEQKANRIAESRPSRARGSKRHRRAEDHGVRVVAPLAGAWIETVRPVGRAQPLHGRAPRGRVDRNDSATAVLVPATGRAPRGRVDRNSNSGCFLLRTAPVAPLAGAWIETYVHPHVTCELLVAPLAGAWIETRLPRARRTGTSCRAPRGRVDRNVRSNSEIDDDRTSRPSRARGSKRSRRQADRAALQSRPSRARGSKRL